LAPGTWYIGGLADYFNQISESNESDNNANRVAITVLASNLTEYVRPLSGTTVASGGTFSLRATTYNNGAVQASPSTARIYISPDPIITGQDTLLASHVSPAIDPGGDGSFQNFTVTLPSNLAPGTWYIGGLADYFGQVSETNEGDNNANYVTINVLGANLTEYVRALSSTTVLPGGNFSLRATTYNSGPVQASPSTARIYLSPDPIITGQDTLLASHVSPAIDPGGDGSFQNFTVTLPSNLAPGTWYIGGLADYFGQVAETNEGDNNANYVTITVPGPNLTEYVRTFSNTQVLPGTNFSIQATTYNSGTAQAPSSTARIYLSQDTIFNDADTLLVSHVSPAVNPGGDGSSQDFVVTIPGNLAPGTWYIGGVADYFGQVRELNEGDNNSNFITINVPAAPSTPASQFSINFNYSGDPQYQQYFTNAAARWSQVILNDLPDVNSPTYGFIDDLLINVNIAPIDGAGGILGQAGWDLRRSGTNGLPYHGTMTFDSADVAGMVANGTFGSVVLHEIGHILGLGTLWDTFGLRSGSSYIGTNAVNAYRQLAGNNSLTGVPLETGGGAGTALAHWSEASFDTELMTGWAEAPGVAMPLSTVTIGSLQDLGYTVNYGAADPYSLPGHLESSIASETATGSGAEMAGLSGLQLANSIASTFADTGALSLPAAYSPGAGEASLPLASPTPEQLKHV